MHILLITQWFEPEPHFKGLQFARALKDSGHTVEVLTGFPNYPGGQIYSGYRLRPYQREIMDGIPVLRGYLYPSHDQSAMRRIANYVTFAISTTILILFIKKPDVVYVYTPPTTAATAALALRLLRRVPFVVDVQDLWPDTLAATGMVRNARVLGMVGRFTNIVLGYASRIIVLSEGFRSKIQQRGVETPIAVVPNWAPPEIVAVAGNLPPPAADGVFVVLFAGNMGKAQCLQTAIDAAKVLADTGECVRFDFVGGGVEVEHLKAYAAQRSVHNVHFHPARHPSQMQEMFAMSDALLVHLRDDPLFEITIPSKTQAYLAIGKPILMGVRGDAARMVESANAGICFEPESSASLADAIRKLIVLSPAARVALGRAGRGYYDKYLDFRHGVEAIASELVAARDHG